MLDAEFLRTILAYDPETGTFHWKRRTDVGEWWNGRYAGKQTGLNVDSKGYYTITINDHTRRAHRIAWLMVHGSLPDDEIDHINNDRKDNRIANLRLVSKSQNKWNTRGWKKSRVPLKGVDVFKDLYYRARICVNYKTQDLGYFDCPAAAHFAYVVAADKLHGIFAKTR